jgi:hypothetical protein
VVVLVVLRGLVDLVVMMVVLVETRLRTYLHQLLVV